jgi:hypothetical protein
MEEGKTQINKIKDEKRNITTNTSEIQRTIREYFENLYSSKLESLEEMDKFLETFNQPKLSQEAINNINRSITSNEIEKIIKESTNKEEPRI